MIDRAAVYGLAALLLWGCGSEPTPISSQAIHLALKSQTAGILVDETLARQLDDALARAATVTPVQLRCLNVSADYEFERLSLAGVSEPAYSAWVDGYVGTGVPALDEIALLYEFESVDHLVSFDTFIVTLGSPVRVDRLADEVVELDTIGGAFPISVSGVSSNIELIRSDSALEFRFWLGWGDCASGCIESHTWVTQVPTNENAAPLLIEDSGDEVPPALRADCLRPAE